MSTPLFRRFVELFWFWLYPAGVFWLTLRQYAVDGQATPGWFMVLAPALTMYVVVGTGAGLLRFWYFTTSYSPGGVMLTIGLLYSAVLNPFASLFRPFISNQPWVFVAGVALGGAVLGTFVDVFLLHARLLHVKSKHYPVGSNAIRHALSYGPVFFGFVGLVNALGLVYGYGQLTQNPTTLVSTLAVVVIGCVLPFLLFLSIQKWRQVRHRRACRTSAG